MGATVPGGRYLTTDGRLVNAHGEDLPPTPAPPAIPPVPKPGGTPLPVAFPHHVTLASVGITTRERLDHVTDAQLLSIPKIGKAAVRAIRAA